MPPHQAPPIVHIKAPPSDSDDVIGQVNGNFGRWQLRTILLIFLLKIPSAWLMAAVIYTAPAPQKGSYYCKPPPTVKVNSTEDWIKISHPSLEGRRTDREFSIDACNVYETALHEDFAALNSNYSNPFEKPRDKENIIPCEHFQHSSAYESLVTQFDLVCSRQLLIGVSQTFHAMGSLIGGLIAKSALHYISPRQLMMVGMICQIVCGNLTGLMPTFNLHIFFRLITSIFCCFMYTSGQIILTDITGGKAKVIIRCLFELFWSIGLILLPGISIFVDSWTHLYFVISSSTIILVFLHRWIADSPRWLAKYGKYDEALQELLESAAVNNKDIPLDLEDQLKSYGAKMRKTKPPPFWSVWDGQLNWKYVLAVHWAWVWAVVLYNAMLLVIRQFGVDHIHVNTASMGFAEMIGVFVGLYLILYTKRHWQWAGLMMIVTGLLAYLIWVIPENLTETRRVGMGMIFCLGMKVANAVSMSVLTTCSGELVKPERRTALMFSVVTHSRFWLTFAPLSPAMSVIHPLTPLTMFASFAVLNGLLMCYLNTKFWNEDQPVQTPVPSLDTYRKNSAVLMRRRSSVTSDLNVQTEITRRVSITDLWGVTPDEKIDEERV